MRQLQLDGYSLNLFEQQAENDRMVARGFGKVVATKKLAKELHEEQCICPRCGGCGLGAYPGEKCVTCSGTGEV